MSAGRKWMVAVVVGLVGILALYYGVLSGPGTEPGTEASTFADDPTLADNDEEAMEQADRQTPTRPATSDEDDGSGFLSQSMNGQGANATSGNNTASTRNDSEPGPYSVIGPDGTVQPVTIAHDPNNSLMRDLSNSGTRPVVKPDPGKGDVVVPSAPPIDDPLRGDSKPEPAETAPTNATPAVATTTLPPKFETYVIKAGDTMSSIAAEWFGEGKKWDLIAKANPLIDPTKMQIGQKLNLPPKTAEREKPKPGAREYTVRPGDTLVSIARAIYGDGARWKTIYEANKKTIGSDPDNIREGLTLTIPSASRS